MPQPVKRIAVDAAAFRTVMSIVCSQVVIATTLADSRPHGTTVTAFASLSLEPPMVSVALDENSQLLQQVRLGQGIGINLLARGQEQLALRCAGKGPDKFASVSWSVSDGLPRIDDVAGWLACAVDDEILLGDHVLIVARVLAAEIPSPARAPLVYAGRAFGTHSDWLGQVPGRERTLAYEPLDRWADWTN
jgi:flavin reductase (DIM6/NTAB) family NADH-FMN oxidoreductase RutF